VAKVQWMVAASAGALMAAGTTMLPAEAGHGGGKSLRPVADLSGPRGVASVGPGMTLVTEDDATFSLVVERKHKKAKVVELGSAGLPGFANAIDGGRHHQVYIATGGAEPGTEGAASLFRWKPGWDEPKLLADIAAYQASDPDPDDLEGAPEESNPYGVEALRRGGVLVADAAGNDLLRVRHNGDISTVARILPRVVEVPEGLPDTDPEGNPLPPAGTPIPSEGVLTSVTVDKHGYMYVGELRGFPATPGTSSVWRIKPNAKNAVCDWEHPYRGACTLYKTGFTSIVDLASDRHGNIYVLEISKQSWLALELGSPGAEVGALYKVDRHRHTKELAKGQVIIGGGVDVSKRGTVYVTGPVFGPGALARLG
jgi:hypothetical protein